MRPAIHYCIRCASPVTRAVPQGDTHPRAVCSRCGHIHYENPLMIVGCVAEHQERILLCKRAIEPRLGYWTLPAGFMENGETTSEAAARETHEEACAHIADSIPFALVSIAQLHQVHLYYRARLDGDAYAPGPESLEVQLFTEESIPWEEIAFQSVAFCLRRYLEDRRRGTFGFHHTDLIPMAS